MSISKGKNTAVAAFVKTLGHSPLKTRLAKGIGKERAEAFYALSIECIRETLVELQNSDTDIKPLWSVAEYSALEDSTWQDFDRCLQGVGPLGERLSHVFHELMGDFDSIIFIGGDSPQLRPQVFFEAISALRAGKDFCLGPTQDGGYYLFAARKSVPHAVWTDVPYSVSNTFAEFYSHLEALGSVHVLREEFDVDSEEDLSLLKGHLKTSSNSLSPAKQKLLQWLDEYSKTK